MSDSQITAAIPAHGGTWLTRRRLNAIGVLICIAGLGYAAYAQQYLALEPCPLCIFQRLTLLAVGLVFLAALIHNPAGWGAKVYGILIMSVSDLGIGIAARHVWLQHLPPEEAPRCGPGLDYMLETFPLSQTLREVLTGAGECANVDWTVLGFSMPEWNLLLFFSLGIAGFVGNWLLRR